MMQSTSIYEYSVSTFMYKATKRELPDVVQDIFKTTSSIHTYNTRSGKNYLSKVLEPLQ